MAVLSFEAVSTSDPSAENTADLRWPESPIKVCLHCPVETLQIMAVPYIETISTSDPSVEKTADVTALPYPFKV